MNEETGRQVVDELRNLNALIKNAQRANVVVVSLLGVLALLCLATIPLRAHVVSVLRSTPPAIDSWAAAKELLQQDESLKAKAMLDRLLVKYPDYYYGHALMVPVQLELGNLEAAERSAARTVELYPDEDYVKKLAVIRKAILNKKESANRASEPNVAPAPPVQH